VGVPERLGGFFAKPLQCRRPHSAPLALACADRTARFSATESTLPTCCISGQRTRATVALTLSVRRHPHFDRCGNIVWPTGTTTGGEADPPTVISVARTTGLWSLESGFESLLASQSDSETFQTVRQISGRPTMGFARHYGTRRFEAIRQPLARFGTTANRGGGDHGITSPVVGIAADTELARREDCGPYEIISETSAGRPGPGAVGTSVCTAR
jgi:hypothetical protein